MRIIDTFTIGGVAGHPTLPGVAIQKALGSTIRINMLEHELYVPTAQGVKVARPGDQIIAYEDGSFNVVKKEEH